MSTEVRSAAELAGLVRPVILATLARWSGWRIESATVDLRAVSFRLVGARGSVSIDVGASEDGAAAHVGPALRVWASAPPTEPALFDEIARAVAPLPLALELPRPEEPSSVRAFYHPERTERRFHLVNLGLPRTGTTTLAAMFCRWRSAHEYDAERVVASLGGSGVREALQRREEAGRLEVDSASFLHCVAADVVALHPSARFVVTWRPFSPWLDSLLGMVSSLAHDRNEADWLPWERTMLERMLGTRALERLTKDDAVPAIAEHALDYWQRALDATLDSVPEDTLLIETSSLRDAAPRLAAHVGIGADAIVSRRENASEAPRSFSERLSPAFRAHAARASDAVAARCAQPARRA